LIGIIDMQYSGEIKRFRPSGAVRRRLPVDLPCKGRIAQVSNPAALFEEARYFSSQEFPALQAYAPQILLGSSEALLDLSALVDGARLSLPELNRAIFVLTDCRDVPLRDRTRVILWQTFGVPAYELLLGDGGLLLAAECEAYEGWHIENGVTFSSIGDQLWYSTRRGPSGGTGLTGDLQAQPCPCGRAGKRIVNVAIDFRDAVRHRLLATA
jgi:hypothetical protein